MSAPVRCARSAILILTVLLVAHSSARAQVDDEAAVRAVVQRFFDAMRTQDEAALRATALAHARLVNPIRRGQGMSLRTLSMDQLAEMVVSTAEPYDERMTRTEVRIDTDLATLWGRYTFRVGTRVTNCGTNAVQLVRTDDGWRIAQFASTIETTGCESATPEQGAAAPATLSLMEGPADGVDYHHERLRAQELMARQEYAAAEGIVEGLVRAYPRDGFNWVLLGQTKAALDRHAEAGVAFERAAALLGWNHPIHLLAYHAVANHVQAGHHDYALDLLGTVVFEQRNFYLRSRAYDLGVFADFRTDPEFLRIAGRVGRPESSREARWLQDIDYLVDEVRRVNPDYHDAPLPEEFERRLDELRSNVGRLSDEELFVGLNRMLAVLRQAHLGVFPPARNRHLPMQFYAFPEGVFVVAADSPYASIVGSRVIAIEATPIDEVLRRLADVRSAGSDMQHLWGVSDLSSAYHLKGTGIIDSLESAGITLERDGRRETVRVATSAQAPARRLDKLVAPPDVTPPLFLRQAEQSHWETALPEHDALYVQVNQVRPDPDETVPQFGRRLAGVLAEVRPANLILDLRHNNGGDTNTYSELLRTVIAFSRDSSHTLYVLIGRRVFSATANMVTDLERLAEPIFVGEATSSCCNFTGDPAVAVLPNSGIVAELTAVRWNLSYNQFDTRTEMHPDVPVQLTASAYFAGHDPALEAVLRLIRESSVRP